MSAPASLELFAQSLKKVPDPRSKQGISHPFQTILALVFLGLLGNITTLAEIQRWTENHLRQLKKFLPFKTKKEGQEKSKRSSSCHHVGSYPAETLSPASANGLCGVS